MPFVNTLHVQPIPGSDKRILLWPLVYVIQIDGSVISRKSVLIEAGFVTDYASIPPALFSMFPRDAGDTRRPAVLHDYLYVNHSGYSRAQADNLFLVALKEEGASWFKRYAMWSAVKLFGGKFWS